jgi:hypothetical protein
MLIPGINIYAQQYVGSIIEYKPAPGQYINDSYGRPSAAASIVGVTNGLVTLGFYGGYIVVGFDEPVKNDPDNPYGVDFTVFGNASLGSSEPGIVMVMKDENGNGKADDTWYELRGSDHFLSSVVKNYQITYTNPGGATDVPWTDNLGNNGVVETNSFHTQPYYPGDEYFPEIDQTSYTLSGTKLKDRTSQGTFWVNYRFDYGYADNNPVNFGEPVDVPDNPYTLDVSEGCGGDAFDIDWAVDANGDPVSLDEIDFIKIYNGVAVNAGTIGEVSTEIAGIATVTPNASITGSTDVIVSNIPPNVGDFPVVMEFEWPVNQPFKFEAYVISKGRLNTGQNIRWTTSDAAIATIDATTGRMVGKKTGTVEITAIWELNTSISRSYTINITPSTSTGDIQDNERFSLWPNPATNNVTIQSARHSSDLLVEVFDVTGTKIMTIDRYSSGTKIDIGSLPPGMYILRLKTNDGLSTARFVKH